MRARMKTQKPAISIRKGGLLHVLQGVGHQAFWIFMARP